MQSSMDALVLVGGMGTRLRPVLRNLPKPMASVLSKPFLDYLVRYWLKEGISRFVFCVGYRRKAIETYFKQRYRGVPVDYSIEQEPLGTGGALIQACARLPAGSPVLALNGDTFFDVPLADLKRCHKKGKAELTMALAPMARERRFEGIRASAAGRILKVQGRKTPAGAAWMNAGVYLFKPEIFSDYFGSAKAVSRSFENDILPDLIRRKRRVFGCRHRGNFLDIGTPASYQSAETFIREAKAWKKF